SEGMADQIIPSVLLVMPIPEGRVEIQAVRERVADGTVNKSLVNDLQRLQAFLDPGPKRARRSEARTHGGGLRHQPPSCSLTALRTASPKREEKPVSPPQPATSSSASPGSRLDTSLARTMPSGLNESRWTRSSLVSAASATFLISQMFLSPNGS